MTEQPKFGFLCTGKTPLELSVSIHCAGKMREILREAGYIAGGYYTEILSEKEVAKLKRAGKTLEYLSLSNDFVLTLGCDGFSAGDVLPDLTDVVCTGKASYFAGILCGLNGLAVSEDFAHPPTKGLTGAGRIYSEKDSEMCHAPLDASRFSKRQRSRYSDISNQEEPKSTEGKTLSERLNRAFEKLGAKTGTEGLPIPEKDVRHASRVTAGSMMKIFAGSHISPNALGRSSSQAAHVISFPEGTSHDGASSVSKREPLIFRVPPSRAHAGILDKSLVLNFSNDVYTAPVLLKALLPAINFAVYNLSGKSAAACAEFNQSLNIPEDFNKFTESKHAVNK